MAKSNVLKLNSGLTPRQCLPEAQALYEDMRNGYRGSRVGKRANSKTADDELRVVEELRAHSGQYPWEWSLESWDEWNTCLVTERKIGVATQRKYQGYIRSFINYLERREVFQIRIKGLLGRRMIQFLDDGDLAHHLYDDEKKEPRARFTDEQAECLMNANKQCIVRCQSLPMINGMPHRQLLNHQRDLAMFATFISTGLRAGSVQALNTWSFVENPKIPELGRFGHIFTVGKGSKGHGPKLLNVAVDDLRLVNMLDWYERNVRPYFLSTKNPNETAYFLAEGGNRISYKSIYARFQIYLNEADLANIGLCPHSFRHHKITNCGEVGYDIETIRRIAGHVYASTTQGYMGVGDQFCQNQIDANIRQQIDRANKDISRK